MTGKMFLVPLFCLCMASSVFAKGNVTRSTELRLKDLAGQEVDLAAYTGQSGKPMVLFFWTSWCPYCLKELKVIDQQVASAGAGVDIFAINTGESRRTAERVVRNYNLKVRVLVDDTSIVSDLFGVMGVPTFVMVDAKGEIVYQDNAFPADRIAALAEK